LEVIGISIAQGFAMESGADISSITNDPDETINFSVNSAMNPVNQLKAYLKNLIFSVHQSFLLHIELVLSRVQAKRNKWAFYLHNIVDQKGIIDGGKKRRQKNNLKGSFLMK
jgi:hypothetical protein